MAAKRNTKTNTKAAAEKAPVVETKQDVDTKEPQQEVGNLETPVPTDADTANVVSEEVMAADAGSSDTVETLDEVSQYLTKPNVSIKEKLEYLTLNAGSSVKGTLTALSDFANDFGVDGPEQEALRVASAHYTIYNTLLEVIRSEDNALFKVKLDLVCLYFMTYGTAADAFAPTRMMRYDYEWKWGDNALETYHALVMVFASLSDRSKRAAELERIDLNSALIRDKLELTQDEIDRLIRYFNG